MVSIYSQYPIHECLVPSTLFETGIGNIVVSRLLPGGEIGVCAFIVDVFCLGVKNALFTLSNHEHYETVIKVRLCDSHGSSFNNVEPAFAKRIICGAVDYAQNLGFSPHKDYKKYKSFLTDINQSDCKEDIIFGQDGKPFYISGPNETSAQSKKILSMLFKRCGSAGYDYITSAGEF